MSVEAGIELRFQGTADRTFDILKIEFSLKKTEDPIGGHDTTYAGNFVPLKFADNLHQLSRWAVRQRPQLVEHFVGQSKKARQPRLRCRHSCAAKKKHLPRVARDQKLVGDHRTVFSKPQLFCLSERGRASIQFASNTLHSA